MVRHAMTLLVTLATAALAGCAPRAASTPAPAREGDAIRAVLDSTAAGWNRGDLERYLWAYADSTTAMGANGPEWGREAVRTQMQRGFWKTGRPRQALRYEQVVVRPLGADHALVTGRFVLSGNDRPDRSG